jgi:DNA/RNA-binding domain of Phe-tRNA-synthetase-like protein
MELELAEGWVEARLAEDFPHLGVVHAPVEALPGRSPRDVRDRLRQLANRYTGGHVIHMRQDPVPWAYRVFARQVGIDPDSDRTPVEALALERLRRGGFKTGNVVDDALTIAIAETGVPVFALDADRVEGEPGLRLARDGERLAGVGLLSEGQIVVADDARPVALVMGEVSHDAGVTPGTRRMTLCAPRVKGVPPIAVEEALWTAAEVLVGPAGSG